MKIRMKEGLAQKLLEGSEIINEYVSTTFGPCGKTVILMDDANQPKITKDGVTVARFLDVPDKFANLAVQTIKQASIETVSSAGDGTTTSIILANEIFKKSINYLNNNKYSVTKLKAELDSALDDMVQEIETNWATPLRSLEDLKSVCNISANGDLEIASAVATAIESTGKSGGIIVKPGILNETTLEFEDGYQFAGSYLGPTFVNVPAKNLMKYDNPLILVSDIVLDEYDDARYLLGLIDQEKRPLVIIAPDVTGKALALYGLNAKRGKKVGIVRAPEFGLERREILQDIALAIGGKFIDSVSDKYSNVKLTDFGTCNTLEAGVNSTTLLGVKGDPAKIYERLEQLDAESKQSKDLNRVKALRIRINQLAGGCAVIRVGGSTEVERQEKKDRIEDAIEAARSAKEKGILPGGAVLITHVANKLFKDSQIPGARILMEACEAPFLKLAQNSQIKSPEYLLETLSEANQAATSLELKGIDFSEPGAYTLINLMDRDIIDPFKVTESALKNSVSAASTLLMVGAAIIDERE